MMPAFCINLDRRPDRWARMVALADEHGFALTRVAATDAREPAEIGPLPTDAGAVLGRPILAGDLACSLSHRRVWQMILDQGHDAALVLEDDCVLAPGFAQFLDPGWVPPGVRVVRLETTLLSARYGPMEPLALPGRHMARMRSRHTGTAGSVITRAGAAFLLEAIPQFRDPVDQLLFNDRSPIFADLAPVQVFPAPVIQGQILYRDAPEAWAESEIAPERDDPPPITDSPAGPAIRTWRRLRRAARRQVQRALGVEKIVVPFG